MTMPPTTPSEALEAIKSTLRGVPGFTMDSAVDMFSLFGIVESALLKLKQEEDVAKPTVKSE